MCLPPNKVPVSNLWQPAFRLGQTLGETGPNWRQGSAPLMGQYRHQELNYPDMLYVDSLIGPETVNTVPPTTLQAFGAQLESSVANRISWHPLEHALGVLFIVVAILTLGEVIL